ncbi:MAG: hypothetical protein IJR47_02020 [Clostridia bacterium]|nr:hypothetical protein [Clostridia bacterium]
MNEVVKRIKELGFDEYAVVSINGETVLLVFMGYGYYTETDNDNFSVSPYYFASNRAYFATKELVLFIKNLGYEAQMDNVVVYDNALEQAGAIRGKNNLFFIEELGSLFCVHLIRTNAPLQMRTLKGKACKNCGKCIAACPMGAIFEGGTHPNKCLRHLMDDITNTACRKKITTLLGCDMCQKFCPNNNRALQKKSYPVFNKKKILSGDIQGLAELVGKNMARKRRLMFQAMCVAANTGDTRLLELIEQNETADLNDVKNWCAQVLKKEIKK